MAGVPHRPSFFLLASIWAGIVCAPWFGFHPGILLVTLAGLASMLGVLRRPGLGFLVLVTGCFLLGVLRSPESRWNHLVVPPEVLNAKRFPVVLRVRLPFLTGECTERVRVEVTEVLVGFPSLEGTRVYLRDLHRMERPGGSEFRVVGEFRRPRSRLNPFAPDRLQQYHREGVVGDVVVRTLAAYGCNASPSYLAELRRRLEDLIRQSSDPKAKGMLEALLLGKRANIEPSLGSLMIKAGTYHVLAISGLHVGIVVLVVSAFLSVLRLGRRARIVVAVACVLGFVVFTGARPSAQRAWVFFLLLATCRLLQWKIDYPNCVCATGVILLMLSPSLAWDVGFQLSLAAVFGITLLAPQFKVPAGSRRSLRHKIRRYVLAGLIASFAAQVFTLPLLLYHFGRVSLIGPLANLFALPLVTLIVAAGLEAVLTLPVWAGLAGIFMGAASTLVGALVWSLEVLTRWVDPLVLAGRPGMVRVVAYAVGLGLVTLVRPQLPIKAKIPLLVLLCVFLAVPLPRRAGRLMYVTFLYVGDGDACFIEAPDGTTVLVDSGAGGDTFDAGRTYVLPFLAAKGRKRIDTVMITHSHNDHYGGLISLLGPLDIGEILVGTAEGERPYVQLLEDARAAGVNVRQIGMGDTLWCGDVTLEVLHPPKSDFVSDDPNGWSVVCRLTYGETSILLTGDVTPEVQRRLVESGADLRCDLLKVPHHGAPEGVDAGFAQALGARYAVISVGDRFSSHPSPATISLLERNGMTTYLTRTHGAVTVTSDGHLLSLRTEQRAEAFQPN